MVRSETVEGWDNKRDVLVFLHYFGGSAQSWRWVVEKLSDKYSCIAIDFPGFGGTPALKEPSIQGFADFILLELKRLNVERYTLIGHSMGSKIALQIASDAASGSVQQLILVAPSPPTTEPMPEDDKNRMLHHPDALEAEKSVANAIRHPITQEQHALAIHTQLISDQATWRWWLLKGMNHSIEGELRNFSVPVTVLASTDDPVITYDVIQKQVMKVLKQATLITTSRVGHLSPLETPGWVAARISDLVSARRLQKQNI